jgi:uncharacterized protein YwgA
MVAHKAYLSAARIIEDAGGELVGRTRLQKIAFLLQLAGFGDDFEFEYRHYGPYSEDLAQAIEVAVALGPVEEEEKIADWGGRYSVYKVHGLSEPVNQDRRLFVQMAKRIDAVELELAATAAYLFIVEGFGSRNDRNPWEETKRRKASKAGNGRLERAAKAYEELRKAKVVKTLPELPNL